jgi:type VI secretion system protein ImpB
MSKSEEGSVAPNERVNIVYRPATEGAREDVELPMKMLVVGDFTGVQDGRPVEERTPVEIDKDNFGDVLKSHGLRLHLQVPDKLSGNEKKELEVNLEFASLGDFSPERVAAQVPTLKALLEMREALSALKGPLANVPAFRSRIQSLVKDGDARKQLLGEMGIGEQEDHHV